jgi:putative Mg2+ transporter-C (MgtC) family protein
MISFSEIVSRLTVALLLGALIGLEREWRYHTAGLRTNALVSLGSALFTIISAFGFISLTSYTHVQVDPTRIASYVVAGIGFLGGGTIYTLQKEEKVKGLTTASAIWVVAAIGMACGAGMLWEATLTTLLALLVLVGLHYVETKLLPSRRTHTQFLHLDVSSISGPLLEQLYEMCKLHDVEIEKIDIQSGEKSNSIDLHCRFQDQEKIVRLLGSLPSLPAVQTIQSSLPIAGRKSAL